MKKKGFIIGFDFYICFIILVVTFALLLEYYQPLAKYIRLNQIVRKYTLRMETNSGLSLNEYTNLQKELQDNGFKLGDTKITATQNAKFGEDVTLEIIYLCRYEKKSFNWTSVSVEERQFEMNIRKSSIGKKGR